MKRLPAIFSLIPNCGVFADIGCDHGFISQYVLDNKLADKVIAADISNKCLQKAQRLLKGYDNVEFVCTDGLNGISADVVVIAGLGGGTIINILLDNLNSADYILQAQDKCYELRLFLTQNGYRIQNDFLAKENNKYYDIIFAKPGSQELDEFQAALGSFYNKDSDLLQERLYKEYKTLCSYNDGGKNDSKRAFLKEALERITITKDKEHI